MGQWVLIGELWGCLFLIIGVAAAEVVFCGNPIQSNIQLEGRWVRAREGRGGGVSMLAISWLTSAISLNVMSYNLYGVPIWQ
jgi:hypothetical protein